MSHRTFLDQVGKIADDPTKALDMTLAHLRVETGTVHQLGSDGSLHLKAWAGGIPEPLLDVIRTIPVGKGIAGLAVERKKPVNLCNLQTDQSGDVRPRARETGAQGSICVPMMTDEDRPVGALGIATQQERDFTDDEIEVLMQVGRLLASRTETG